MGFVGDILSCFSVLSFANLSIKIECNRIAKISACILHSSHRFRNTTNLTLANLRAERAADQDSLQESQRPRLAGEMIALSLMQRHCSESGQINPAIYLTPLPRNCFGGAI